MATPRVRLVDDDEFISIWNKLDGSAIEVARFLGMSPQPVHARRRRIEAKRKISLLCKPGHPSSPDSYMADVAPEFPDWQELEIESGLAIVFSDAHLVPGVKFTAHRALLKMVAELKPAAIIDNGDLLDFASIARHHRIGWDKRLEPRKELEWAIDCLHEIKQLSKNSKTLRNMGNHDQRFSGYFSNISGRMGQVKGTSLQDHIVGWPVAWATRINHDQLEVTHRWKSGIHAPWNNVMNAGISYATGHLHSQKVYPLTDLKGDRWGVDVGTMSAIYGPHFRYMEAKPRNHRSGFCVFRFVNYELRHPMLVRVIDEKTGACEYNGNDFRV